MGCAGSKENTSKPVSKRSSEPSAPQGKKQPSASSPGAEKAGTVLLNIDSKALVERVDIARDVFQMTLDQETDEFADDMFRNYDEE